jgi:C-terminal processing protease CtpA/Prc
MTFYKTIPFCMKKVFFLIQILLLGVLFFGGCATGDRDSGKYDEKPGADHSVLVEQGVHFIGNCCTMIVDNFYPSARPEKMLDGALKRIGEDYQISVSPSFPLPPQLTGPQKEKPPSAVHSNEADNQDSDRETPDACRSLIEIYRLTAKQQARVSPMPLAFSMVDGMLKGLDSYSELLTPESYNNLKKTINRTPCIQYTMISPGYGYIRILDFNSNTTHEMIDAIHRLQAAGHNLKGLILDLRDNHGGLFEQAIAVTDLFLKKGVILHIQGRNEINTKTAKAHPNVHQGDYPIIVLINSASASGSEIVAGALQDNLRALIMGERSYGKGVAQTVVKLYNNYALKFTFIGYVRPNGMEIQGRGITPDVVLEYEHEPFSLTNMRNDYLIQRALQLFLPCPSE